MKRKLAILVGVLAVVAISGGLYFARVQRARVLVLTGLVSTDGVIVSSEIAGRLQELLVKEGDAVKAGQLIGRIQAQEWKAEMAFFANTERQSASQVTEARADLRFQEDQSSSQVRQAEANLEAAHAQVAQGEADLENASLNFKRREGLYRQSVETVQEFDQARTALDGVKARVESLRRQVEAAQAALALAKASAGQVAARRAALEATTHQLAAAAAQKDKAKIRLDYTEIHAPIDGFIDVRAALQGEVVTAGQPIVTLINPDELWVRADVEETYIDRIHLGDVLSVRLPSGARRPGVVFYRRVDGDFATQRDVSRTKRDIRTFEIRLRCDNHDRGLAVGMSAYVSLPVGS
ncbi:MAG TPA: efflux RND transporter periplasmic adaptor subunit [Dongiaceae bacterium]|nr:efflux RND transporter periplasmic adaptor subunit [Dongiaceae bacterium]